MGAMLGDMFSPIWFILFFSFTVFPFYGFVMIAYTDNAKTIQSQTDYKALQMLHGKS